MPENEFEKKVSSEMQGLKLKPSENVWLRVEERIRKKNKRRIFVIFFLLAGLALLGYWQRNNLFGEKRTGIVTTEKPKDVNAKPLEETNNSSTTKQSTEATKQEEIKNTPDKNINNKSTVTRSVIDKKDVVGSKKEIDRPKNTRKIEPWVKPPSEKTKIEEKPKVPTDVTVTNSQKQDPVIKDAKAKDTVVLKTDPEPIIKPDEVKQPAVRPIEKKIDSLKADLHVQEKIPTEKTDTLLKAEPAKEAFALKAKKDSSEKKWKWGLHLTPGISSLHNTSISFDGLETTDRFNYQSPVGSGTGAAPGRQKPSDVKAGFAFQAGVFAQRQLSPRISVSIGVQYGYYSSVIGIGNRRDSLVRTSQFSNLLDEKDAQIYNAGGDTVKYTNRYHFVELPLQFQWQLNKSTTHPFVWSAGFTLGQLFASNALMYDTAFNGIYYKNNKLLNKTQFSLSTGFSWTIAKGKQSQWNFGPVANIHLNRLVDNPFESKKYLFFAGLRTSIVFDPKK